MRAVALSRELDALCVESVACLLDVAEDSVRATWAELGTRTAYRVFRLSKGRGRLIHVPSPLLAALQRRVLERLLRSGAASPAAYAGVPGRSILDAARLHLTQARHVLTADVRRAFPSTTWGHVARALRKRLKPELRVLALDADERARVAGVLAYLTTVAAPPSFARRLPLGAPSSVALFNLVCLPVDRALLSLTHPDQPGPYAYSRYVDDMVISHAGRFEQRHVESAIREALWEQRLRLHDGKTALHPPRKAVVHGLCRTRRGVEPTPGRMRAWQIEIARHEQVLARRDATEEERRVSREWLQGMDGYLQQIYERNDIRRPRGLRVGTVAALARDPIAHLDELWP